MDGTNDEGEASMPTPNRERIQEDLDELLRQSATLAKALLIRNGEFFPFGATIGTRGKFSLVTPVPEGDLPTSQDVIDAILKEIGATRQSLRASSVTAMATTESGADAVRIELEHAQGSSLVIALPFSQDSGMFAYGEMEAHRSSPSIWAEPTPRKPSASKTRSKKTPATGNRKAVKPSAPRRPSTRAAGSSGRATETLKDKPSPHRAPRSAQRSLHSQPALF